MSRWVGLLLLVAGCGKAPGTGLKDLPGLKLLTTTRIEPGGTPRTELQLAFDETCYGTSLALSVHLDGFVVGGRQQLRRDGASTDCFIGEKFTSASAAQLPDANTPASSYFVSDGNVESELRVDHLLAPRQLTVIQPADGVLHPGAQVVLEFSPAVADLAAHPPAVQILDKQFQVLAQADATNGLTGSGSRVTFTVPDGLPADADVQFRVTEVDLQVLRCTLAQSCRAVLASLQLASAHTAP